MNMLKVAILACGMVVGANATAMQLTSTDIREGSLLNPRFVYNGFGCTGGNVSPQLAWANPPAGTQSYAITAYDPDAPSGSGWWHWSVIDIPVGVRALPRGVNIGRIPGARGITNDFGTKQFGGACPPVGDGMHRYEFTVWALPVAKLEVPDNASPALVGFMLNGTALGKAKITSTYFR